MDSRIFNANSEHEDECSDMGIIGLGGNSHSLDALAYYSTKTQ